MVVCSLLFLFCFAAISTCLAYPHNSFRATTPPSTHSNRIHSAPVHQRMYYHDDQPSEQERERLLSTNSGRGLRRGSSPAVDPNFVRDHHVGEAYEHYKNGVKLSFEALRNGAERAHDLNLLAMTKCFECEGKEMIKTGTKSLRTSKAGLAGCLNTIQFSIPNTIKHFYRSRVEPKNVDQTHDEFIEKVRNDRHKRVHNYYRLKDQMNYIPDHH